MIEQPLAYDDLIDHAVLQTQITTPVCLDETLNSLRRAEQAIDLKSCQYAKHQTRTSGWSDERNQNARSVSSCRNPVLGGWNAGKRNRRSPLCGTGHAGQLHLSRRHFSQQSVLPRDLSERPLELTTNAEGMPSVAAVEDIPDPNPNRLQALTTQSWSSETA